MDMSGFHFFRSLFLIALVVLLICGSCFGETYFSEEIVDSSDEQNFFGQRFSLSHVEGTGLGYSIGYSSLDLFLSKSFVEKNVISFLDLRGHLFNNSMYAGNVGAGVRYLNPYLNQIWGTYISYDYFKNNRNFYNQVGMGVEMVSDKWDCHFNVYLPVGKTKKNIYRFQYGFLEDLKNEDFSRLEFGLKAREQFALNGVDALFGYRFCNLRYVDLHVSAGPYYYWGRSARTQNAFAAKHQSMLGGRVVVEMVFQKYIALSGVATYDSMFKWRGQGAITLNIPFDVIFKSWQPGCASCNLKDRLYDSLQRNEIIVVDYLNRKTNDPRVLDPEFEP